MNEINQLKPSHETQIGMSSNTKQALKFIIPAILIIITFLIVNFFTSNPPKAKSKKKGLTPPLTVSVYDVEYKDFQVDIESYGIISPRTQSFLVSSVNGQITEISDKLREGSFFQKGDVLLKIDDRDYLADVKIAEADLADAQQALAEELALSEQALKDWKNLGNDTEPNDLVLRKPQQEAARARLNSARASLTKAKLSLERTEIIAPYDGRVLEKLVDLGQVTNVNTQVAEVYATDYFEVRLPIRTADLKYLDLPKTFSNGQTTESEAQTYVFSSLTESPIPWTGRLVRTESAIDNDARQLHVVAQIDKPFAFDIPERQPLKIGEYVNAEIQGKVVNDAIVIPTESIYQNSYVYIIDEGVIKRQKISISWQNDESTIIASGLDNGDRVVVTSLGQVASGTRARVLGETETKTEEKAKNPSTSNNKSQASTQTTGANS